MNNAFIKNGILYAFLIIVIFSLTIGCNNDSSTGPSINEITGEWSGKTNQNGNISFTVSSGKVTYLKIAVVTPGQSFEASMPFSNCAITNNAFSLAMYDFVSVTGNFKSSNSSEGTYTSGSTSGTWTATKY